jgi:hypothetical protein
MKTRLRNRSGISRSGLRKIERITAMGERAIRRSFVAADRRAFKGGLCHE